MTSVNEKVASYSAMHPQHIQEFLDGVKSNNCLKMAIDWECPKCGTCLCQTTTRSVGKCDNCNEWFKVVEKPSIPTKVIQTQQDLNVWNAWNKTLKQL